MPSKQPDPISAAVTRWHTATRELYLAVLLHYHRSPTFRVAVSPEIRAALAEAKDTVECLQQET
jgi:hypothetical protein